MKQVFKVRAKDEDGNIVTVTTEVQAPKHNLTRDEQRRWKHKIQDEVFNLIRGQGFMCHEIRIGAK